LVHNNFNECSQLAELLTLIATTTVSSLQKISGERSQFSARLIAVLESAHGLRASPTLVAREFNHRFVGKPVTVHAVRKWLVGEAIPTQDKLRALAEWLEVSVEWLRFGSASGNAILLPRHYAELRHSPQEQLVQLFLTLPSRERKLAQEFITMLGKESRGHGQQHFAIAEDINHP